MNISKSNTGQRALRRSLLDSSRLIVERECDEHGGALLLVTLSAAFRIDIDAPMLKALGAMAPGVFGIAADNPGQAHGCRRIGRGDFFYDGVVESAAHLLGGAGGRGLLGRRLLLECAGVVDILTGTVRYQGETTQPAAEYRPAAWADGVGSVYIPAHYAEVAAVLAGPGAVYSQVAPLGRGVAPENPVYVEDAGGRVVAAMMPVLRAG